MPSIVSPGRFVVIPDAVSYLFFQEQPAYADIHTIGVAALQTALRLGPGHTVVTILCDSGNRHLSKFWARIGDIGGEARTTLDDILEGTKLS